MSDDLYKVDEIVTGTETIVISDDSTGNDTLQVVNLYGQTVEINLAWTSDSGNATSAESLYFFPTGVGHRLIVNGVIENAIGSNGSDFIQGNELANIIFGDEFATGAGLDDTLWGGSGADTVHGGAGVDGILGGNGNDSLFGDGSNDNISGDGGDDTIEGGEGADTLTGGASAGDTVSYAKSAAGVQVDITFGSMTLGRGGDAEGDSLGGFPYAIGSGFDDVITDTVSGTVAFGGNDNRFEGGAGNDSLTMGGGDDLAFGGDDRDTLDGGSGNDQLWGDAGRDSLTGGAGNDLLVGGAGGDTMIGGAGDDTFTCDAATDVVTEALNEGRDLVLTGVNWTLGAMLEDLTLTGSAISGSGNNRDNFLTGNAQNNVMQGWAGRDTMHGGDGNDSMTGGAGDDILDGDNGNDTMVGGQGNDTYYCRSNTDIVVENQNEGRDLVISNVNWTLQSTLEDLTLAAGALRGTGNSRANVITGNLAANTLRGFFDNDTLSGLGGRDTLEGGAGDDILIGGRQADVLTGDLGADRFVFASTFDFQDDPGSFDTITDFTSLQGDKIDLSGIDAKTGVLGDQAFTFLGLAAFSGRKGELRVEWSGTSFTVQGDVNGDGAADFTLQVTAVTSLIDTDFSL